MRILSVDDSSVVRKIIRAATDVLEFQLSEAEDGQHALEVLGELEGQVDLILLDWNMPGMNGYELLKKLKSDVKYKSIPVMMVTTESSKSNIVSAIQAGAANYMVKPFSMDELTKKILECLGRGSM
jgi:two-component system, chemotaxis family, chemotaxis protein CheY